MSAPLHRAGLWGALARLLAGFALRPASVLWRDAYAAH